ncbi:FAD-dependent oxidoreductase [Alloscardovia venturai]|uniref:FAD-dependent oxidoreductase n=1 Tax=Alloscardovia venturai TaxID=1769421 RepID=A0ABW2Y4S8_9BIFI
MAFDYDVIVIGSGPGGYATALRTADFGLHTAVIEMRDEVGGTCLNRGCIPTKAYVTASHTLEYAKNASSWGLDISVNTIDMQSLKAAKDKTVAGVVKGLSQHMKSRKIDIIHGYGSLVKPHEVCVDDGEMHHTFTAQHVVLATGSYSTTLPGFDFFNGSADEVRQAVADGQAPILSSDEALDIDVIPENVVIVGAGTIALEFANIWNTLGTHVTVLLRKDVPLSHGDNHISAMMMRTMKRAGIHFETRSQLKAVENGKVTYTVHDMKSDEHKKIEKNVPADFVLVAIGRSPQTTASWFASSGLNLSDHGFVITDKFGRTNIDNVWALGDITQGRMLAHQAFEQALTISESIAGIDTKPVDTFMVPQVVFATVESLSVGYTAQEAEKNGFAQIEETVVPMLSNPRVAMLKSNGTTVIVSAYDAQSGQRIVIGIHMVGPQVSELSGTAREIIENKIPLHDAAGALFAHPTLSESLGEALLKADGRPLNVR